MTEHTANHAMADYAQRTRIGLHWTQPAPKRTRPGLLARLLRIIRG